VLTRHAKGIRIVTGQKRKASLSGMGIETSTERGER